MARGGVDTPLMRQYLEIKQRYPDAILLFRLGDFYEMFFNDAVVAAQTLALTLTSRDKHQPDPVPMCGVPHHAAKGYVRKLLDAGFKVAICEQVEDPRLARGLTRREVTEVVTPGVVLDTDHLDARCNNFLVALHAEGAEAAGLAALDLSTFELRLTQLEDTAALLDELARLRPKEVLHDDTLGARLTELRLAVGGVWHLVAPGAALSAEAALALLRAQSDAPLEAAALARAGPAVGAAGIALQYAASTQPVRGVPACRTVFYQPADHLQLDEATLVNLEVLSGSAERTTHGSLLWVLDRTTTPMGSRLLRQLLARPLREVAAIRRRQDAVELLFEQPELRRQTREALREVADVERLTARAVLEAATPRELRRLGHSLRQLPLLARALAEATARTLAGELPELLRWPDDLLAEVAERIETALLDDAPPTAREGGVFRPGVSAELDELVELAEGGRTAIAQLETALRNRTGIASLKVRFNRVVGYYIEVTKANLRHVPDDFQRKHSTLNAERFSTAELQDYELRVLGAQDRRNALEQQLFEQLRREVGAQAGRIKAAAERLAWLDVLCALAEVAQAHNYCRPLVDDSPTLEIEQGRHPVVERFLPAGQFVANDLRLDGSTGTMLIITGPNMAGKSTVIRQVALIALLAQIGSFVPCRRARLGVVDRIFTRVGASDNLARGESTFMVEMRESAAILRHASARSLVVLDEIGRGTSTYDGISIAWAVAEYLHDRIGSRTLFATHYHELCQLAAVKPRAHNCSVAVQEWQGRVVFLHQLVPGPASRSYGIEVARLAGLPSAVIARARQVLATLEGREQAAELPLHVRPRDTAPTPQLSLTLDAPPAATHALVAELRAIATDRLTPLEALTLLDRLVTEARGESRI
ncbi:MAG: DNA mismatch repair protein MutS [Proteobacteria bacterium]|nr:DNA mismatch repair protein MutS [Pseudomonadota bacterium]